MSEGLRVHGGVDERELASLGIRREQLLDLSVNVHPWGPHPDVVAAIARAPLTAYPQPRAAAACAALARSCGVDEARVIVGHGSTELLWSAVALLRGSTRPLLSVGPTFSEPLTAARAHAVPHVEFRMQPHALAPLDLATLLRAIADHDAAAVYLCQPNNPDGSCLPAAAVRELCAAQPTRLFILDQAFLSLSHHHAEAALVFPDNTIVVRSLTKEHALPGLRIGYALAAPSWIERLHAQRPSWMVSTLAEAAISAACEQPAYVRDVRERLLACAAALAAGCAALGLTVIPSQTPFFLIEVPDADALRTRLLRRHGIVVRSCSSFGLPRHIRIAGCEAEDRPRVLAALRAELCS